MSSLLYRLEGREPVWMEDTVEWARWMGEHREERRVGLVVAGPLTVSTVFLGVDQAMVMGEVELFETVAYRSATVTDEEECRRVAESLEMEEVPCPPIVIERMVRAGTWEQAERAHEEMVKWAWGQVGN